MGEIAWASPPASDRITDELERRLKRLEDLLLPERLRQIESVLYGGERKDAKGFLQTVKDRLDALEHALLHPAYICHPNGLIERVDDAKTTEAPAKAP